MSRTAPDAYKFLSPEQQAEVERLRDEVLALDAWIETRQQPLEKTLTEHVERARNLMRLPMSSAELAYEHRRTEALKKEINSLNELRQVRALKAALLRQLGVEVDAYH
ncbi:MAG TPA: hypothetical protein VFM05_10130 [Candidatus Saccharimonadales bacterium]|nr:hypothetical protein [Candidatus Saccharimonadales bacterium]